VPEQLSPYGDEPGAAILAQQLDDFNASHPDIQIEVIVKQAHGRGGLLDFLRTARDAAPSVVPDLVVLDAAELETATSAGLIQPLDDLLSPSITASRFPFATALGAVEEQTMGFVVAADVQHLAYRPALSASPPISWAQVISPPIPFLFPAGGLDRQVNDATLIQYLAAGGRVTDPDGNPWLDEEVMVSVLGFYSDCTSAAAISPTFDTPAISPTIVLDITDADQAWERFQAGEGGMTVVRANRYWLEADEIIAAAPIPTHDGQPFSIARGWAIAMVADDPARQSLAMLLLDWLIAPNHSAQWTQASGYLPGTRDALRLWSISSVDRATLRSVMEAAVPPPQPKALAIVGPAMQEALEAVLRGWDTPEEAAAAAVKSLEE
jgi:ABC-type glycerol-3-phosphate transport system substrate-binding protein